MYYIYIYLFITRFIIIINTFEKSIRYYIIVLIIIIIIILIYIKYILAYNILNGFVDVDPDKIFDVYSNRCRGPAQKIRKILCRTNAHLNYFGNRVSTDWNTLPINVLNINQ